MHIEHFKLHDIQIPDDEVKAVQYCEDILIEILNNLESNNLIISKNLSAIFNYIPIDFKRVKTETIQFLGVLNDKVNVYVDNDLSGSSYYYMYTYMFE